MKNSKIKEFYNENIGKRYQNDYEFKRWFSNSRKRADYFMTHTTISHYLGDTSFSRCLEVGPGPGTWTRIVFRSNPNAKFDLLDISEEMREQFKLEMRQVENVNYIINDFTEHETQQKYDFFFSSRAIEYFESKKKFLEQVRSLTAPGATCCLIAKNPSTSKVLFGKSFTKHKFPHGAEISNKKMKELLVSSGFSDIKFYPVVIRVPILDRFFQSLREIVFRKLLGRELSDGMLSIFSESYLVIFKNS